eukprot:1161561-Pelagomonas_calceolata.AAC.10
MLQSCESMHKDLSVGIIIMNLFTSELHQQRLFNAAVTVIVQGLSKAITSEAKEYQHYLVSRTQMHSTSPIVRKVLAVAEFSVAINRPVLAMCSTADLSACFLTWEALGITCCAQTFCGSRGSQWTLPSCTHQVHPTCRCAACKPQPPLHRDDPAQPICEDNSMSR